MAADACQRRLLPKLSGIASREARYVLLLYPSSSATYLRLAPCLCGNSGVFQLERKDAVPSLERLGAKKSMSSLLA